MSICEWACQGIGFEQNSIIPYLDADKLEKLINEKGEDCSVDDDFKAENSYNNLDNNAKVKLLFEEIICCEDYQLALLLAAANEEQVLVAETDGQGQCFLLYPPRYPWNNTGEFSSQEELVVYIAEQVQPFCKEGVTMKDIVGIIDVDIYVMGWG